MAVIWGIEQDEWSQGEAAMIRAGKECFKIKQKREQAMSETVLQHALRERNEAMDEISHACEVLSAFLHQSVTLPSSATLMALRKRLGEFYCREWPRDEP